MPSGRIHYRFFKLGYLVQIPTSIYLFTLNPVVGIGYFLGYSFHRWMDNDMDLMNAGSADGRMVNEIPILGYFLFGISSIYGAIFRRKHRSLLTHLPVLSSFIRMLFFYWWILLLYYFKVIQFQYWHFELFYSYLWSISIADGIHYFADLVWQEDKDGKLHRR